MTEFSVFEEQVFLSTVLFQNRTDNEFGTGFLVGKPAGEGRTKILLFSNKHVFFGKDPLKRGIAKQGQITLHKKNDDGNFQVGLHHQFVFPYKDDHDGVYCHPDPVIDVACVNVSGMYNQVEVASKHLDFDMMTKYEKARLFAGKEIKFVGYPSGFYDTVNYMPVMRTGYLASIPSIPFRGKPQCLIDAEVFPGSSGSPVFALLEGHYKLIGIMSESAIRKLDTIDVPVLPAAGQVASVAQIPVQYLGLGMMFNEDALRSVYDLA